MRAYPIWNIITSCAYKSDKSYGIKEHGENQIVVGTSRSNSHTFITTKTTHKHHENGDRTYHFYVNDKLIKSSILEKGASELKEYIK